MGPSGSGKTSFLHAICGLRRPDSGEIVVAGRNVWELSSAQRAAHRLSTCGLVLQFPELIDELTVAENVALPLLLQRVSGARERAASALASVGLDRRGASRPRELSGGEAQRVAIARAIVGRPAVIVADEPTGSVDARAASALVDLLLSYVESEAAVLILATHDRSVAERTDALFRLDDGRLILEEQAAIRASAAATMRRRDRQ